MKTVENISRNLKSLEIERNSYGSLLVTFINEKLPNDLKLLITGEFESNAWSWSKMLEHFKKEREDRDRAI